MSQARGSSRCGGRGRSPLRKPNAVDQHVGARLRLRRHLLGLSQAELAARLGLALQQVQKYESGTNRISASRLYQLCQVLEVPITWFFEEMPDAAAEPLPPAANDRGALELVRSYERIEDETLRRKLCDIAKGFAAARR